MAPVSAAERQRQCRARLNADPERKERHLEKERERWRQKKKTRKSIHELNQREQRHRRKLWREQQKRSRERKTIRIKEAVPGSERGPGPSRQKIEGRKKSKKDRKKLKDKVKKLQDALAAETKLKERYKKRFQRLLMKSVSPARKVRYARPRNTPSARKALYHEALIGDLQQQIQQAGNRQERRLICNLVTGNIVKKYRLQKYAQSTLGFTRRRCKSVGGNPYSFSRKKCVRLEEEFKNNIRVFYTRDDVSRVTTGKKQTITQAKVRMQKRFLVDTLKNLHKKYLAENPRKFVSYSMFCRLRPYWVVHPVLSDRETCLCKLHENLGFVAQKLFSMKLLKTTELETLMAEICCDQTNKECMYNDCWKCKEKGFTLLREYEGSTQVAYMQWVTEETKGCTHTKDNTETVFKKTVKKKVETTLDHLIELFNDMLVKFKRHAFNIRQQYRHSRELKRNMTDQECTIHVDFSENYICKYASEIQAVHFGASHEQATLHTGVLYVGPDAEPVCFSTISPSRLKGPPAIWEHLRPILSFVKNHFPAVSVVHFLSDGPCTQYRQKGNFYLFTSLLYKMGFQAGTWNFFEASHGKGAPDGVGGSMKRCADRLVSHGHDIRNAKDLFEALMHTDTTLKLFYVTEESIERAMMDMPVSIPQVPSTMRIHQVLTTSPGHMVYRDVSCMCTVDKIFQCTCYNAKTFSFNTQVTPTAEEIKWGPEVIQKWCVIKYDGDIYPGIISAYDEVQVQVKCMHRVGVNRFFWPTREDMIWYFFDDVIRFIPPPQPVTTRHHEIQKDIWAKLVTYGD